MGGMSRALPALLCTCLLAALPAAAAAKGPPREPDDGPDPRGLALSGTGTADVRVSGRPTQATIERAVATARPAAIGRAVRRARARAVSLAAAAGLTLGPAVVVTVRDRGIEQGFIGRERYCSRPRRGARRLRCSAPRMTAATVSLTFATAQTSAARTTGRALMVPAVATVPVLPEDRRSSPSILRALVAAQDAATPAALVAGRRSARTVAAAAGIPAGALVAIAEVRRPFDDFYAGSFSTGRFCGILRLPVVRRDPGTGRRRIVRRMRRRSCSFPRELSVGLRLTYAS
jgi:hypothetical protein